MLLLTWYARSAAINFQLSFLTMEHKNKHYCVVLCLIPYLEEKEPVKRLILIYRFSDRVTSEDIPYAPNASGHVFTRKGI